MPTLRAAALEGLGIVQLPTLLIWPDVQAGRLVPVLPEWRPPAGIIHAVFPSRRGLPPSVRALLDFFAHECALKRARHHKVVRPHEICIAGYRSGQAFNTVVGDCDRTPQSPTRTPPEHER